MFDYLKSYEFVSMIGLFTYWIPAGICLTVYLFRFIDTYRQDLKNCTDKYYTPQLTLGVVIWYLLCAIIPAINLFTLVFDCASSVFKWLGKTLNFPLVRRKHIAK